MSSDFAIFFAFSKYYVQKKQPDAVCQIVFVYHWTKNFAKCLLFSAFVWMYFSIIFYTMSMACILSAYSFHPSVFLYSSRLSEGT